MNIWETLLPMPGVQALGWTLLHSLWQGAILALVLWILITLNRQRSARLHYLLSVGTLMTMLAWTGLTFWQQHQQVLDQNGVFPFALGAEAPAMEQRAAEVLTESVGIPWEAALPYLSLAWLCGCLFFAFRWIGGVWYLHRLRHSYAFQVNYGWQHKLDKLADRMGVRQMVRLLESSRVEVPMVIGHLKPVILLPFGMLSGISPKQLESILAHELAHIRRYDYLINQFMAVMEMVFFYHPAYWWVANQVEESREHCCDDIAVSVCGDAITYARILTELESRRQQTPHLALGMAGHQSPLMHRIQRIVSPQKTIQKEKVGFSPAIVLTICLVALLWVQPQAQAQEELPGAPLERSLIAPPAGIHPAPLTLSLAPEVAPVPELAGEVSPPAVAAPELSVMEPLEVVWETEPLIAGVAPPDLSWQEKAYLRTRVDSPPPLPPLPPMPAVPPVPPMPPMPDPGNIDWTDKAQQARFEAEMEAYGKKMEKWGEKFGKEWSKAYGEEWGEQFGEQFGEQWGQQMNSRDHEKWAMDQYRHQLAAQEQLAQLHRLQSGESLEQLQRLKQELAAQHQELSQVKVEEIQALQRELAEVERVMAREQAQMAREMALQQREIQREVEREMRDQVRGAEWQHYAPKPDPHNIRLEKFHHVLVHELEQDGLIDNSDHAVEIEIKDDYVKVNGKKLNHRQADKYRDLAERYELENGRMIFQE